MQVPGDLAVGQAPGDQRQHLALPLSDAGQVRGDRPVRLRTPGELRDQAAGHAGREQPVAGRDHRQQIGRRCVLEQESTGTGAQRRVDERVEIEHPGGSAQLGS